MKKPVSPKPRSTGTKYDVGGVLMDRPFKIRRLGHFGLTSDRVDESARFYIDLLGFHVSEEMDMADGVPALLRPAIKAIKQRIIYMLRYNTDHHSLIVISRSLNDLGERLMRKRKPKKGITANQITWQVGSLAEVVDGATYLAESGCEVLNVGRDMPGSNWHCYVADPEGHSNEIYYGIEQIGWNGRSKPPAMHGRGFNKTPPLPQIGERREVDDAIAAGVDLHSGYRQSETHPAAYEVEGVLMARPFTISRIGPVGLFIEDMDKAVQFYRDDLGFIETERRTHAGNEIIYFRNNTEHHSLALLPFSLRAKLGLSAHSSLAWFGLQMGSYRQLRDAIAYLQEKGVRVVDDVHPDLHPGVDHAAWAFDPDGHCLLLYWSMEQIGWDGKPRPAVVAEPSNPEWTETVEETADAFCGQVFLGPHV